MKTNLIDLVQRELIGFHQQFEHMNSYPPHNVLKTEGGYILELACAGFDRSSLTVTQTDYGLQVKGDRSATPAKKYLFQGIATRQFKKTFPIAPNVSVDRVVFQNGMLEVHLTENEGEDLNIEIA